MTFKHMRIQGRELSYVTKRPKGIFAMCWRMIYDGKMEKSDAVITYFKTESTENMIKQPEPALGLLEKYNHPYDVVYTNFVDNIIYEDEYQIAVRVE